MQKERLGPGNSELSKNVLCECSQMNNIKQSGREARLLPSETSQINFYDWGLVGASFRPGQNGAIQNESGHVNLLNAFLEFPARKTKINTEC